ncbi:hypothetical protein [Kordia sp.]|uniref:hypothetical protein n=1 Tax=Kordia sp. TaxID=1965332 RepID=UPI0025BD412B|nr:hypothetical protein [Kordia sp.]MCH2194314.1 hypothetical protein [Kordia sp.]
MKFKTLKLTKIDNNLQERICGGTTSTENEANRETPITDPNEEASFLEELYSK